MALKVIDPEPIIKELADRCLVTKGLECSVLGSVIDMLKAAPAVYNAPYWATEAAYKHGYEKGYEAGKKDSVEVVRCKACLYYHEVNGKDSGKPCGYGWCEHRNGTKRACYDDEFCSCGERKADETV